jgi:hypothetical protein
VPRKSPPRDPNLDHPAVKLFIDICHSTPNHVQRAAIVAQVKQLDLYKAILIKFMNEGRPAHRVDWTLERYGNAQPKLQPANTTTTNTFDTSPEEEAWMRSRTLLNS